MPRRLCVRDCAAAARLPQRAFAPLLRKTYRYIIAHCGANIYILPVNICAGIYGRAQTASAAAPTGEAFPRRRCRAVRVGELGRKYRAHSAAGAGLGGAASLGVCTAPTLARRCRAGRGGELGRMYCAYSARGRRAGRGGEVERMYYAHSARGCPKPATAPERDNKCARFKEFGGAFPKSSPENITSDTFSCAL